MKDAVDDVRYTWYQILIVFNAETGVKVVQTDHTKLTRLENIAMTMITILQIPEILMTLIKNVTAKRTFAASARPPNSLWILDMAVQGRQHRVLPNELNVETRGRLLQTACRP